MNPVLLIDFGSTYTKVTAVDTDEPLILGTSSSYTTVETDINDGLEKALSNLYMATGPISFSQRYACSSAAGGLKMITSGLVPELTAEAARLASLGAGAKILKVYSYELNNSDIRDIQSLSPDIILLVGGTDGGNSSCILNNSKKLSSIEPICPVVIAGNRNCVDECEELLSHWDVHACENVMPRFGQLNIAPTQAEIRKIFLDRIISAKGLSRAGELISGIIMPTPSAVLEAMKLLSKGTPSQNGLGELIAVDLGGATTDVYSMASGEPTKMNTILKGIPEPYEKRTVEGDIGMRYSVNGIVEAGGIQRISELSGLDPESVSRMVAQLSSHTDMLPDSPEWENLDFALASIAVETAVKRHAGTIEEVYTPMGLAYMQSGKDLSTVKHIIVTGGAIIHTRRTGEIAMHALSSPSDPSSLRPQSADIYVDRKYILAAMGLLSQYYPDAALTIMKNTLSVENA